MSEELPALHETLAKFLASEYPQHHEEVKRLILLGYDRNKKAAYYKYLLFLLYLLNRGLNPEALGVPITDQVKKDLERVAAMLREVPEGADPSLVRLVGLVNDYAAEGTIFGLAALEDVDMAYQQASVTFGKVGLQKRNSVHRILLPKEGDEPLTEADYTETQKWVRNMSTSAVFETAHPNFAAGTPYKKGIYYAARAVALVDGLKVTGELGELQEATIFMQDALYWAQVSATPGANLPDLYLVSPMMKGLAEGAFEGSEEEDAGAAGAAAGTSSGGAAPTVPSAAAGTSSQNSGDSASMSTTSRSSHSSIGNSDDQIHGSNSMDVDGIGLQEEEVVSTISTAAAGQGGDSQEAPGASAAGAASGSGPYMGREQQQQNQMQLMKAHFTKQIMRLINWLGSEQQQHQEGGAPTSCSMLRSVWLKMTGN